MAALINVNGSDDPSYRYKMPRLVGKIEGRGNGIKTVIVNCSDIAQALHRPSGQVTKFFGCELGAMSKYEEKIDRSLVNGAFETGDLQNILTKYIEKFVLCPSCGNPETTMELKGKKKSATIWLSCKACGSTSEADNSHKLCTYILKEMSGPSKGSTKEERKKKRAERRAAAAESKELDGDEGDGDASSEKKEKKKKKSKKKDKDKSDDSDKERRRKKKEKKRREKERAEAEIQEREKGNPQDTESSGKSAEDEGEEPVPTMDKLIIDDSAAIDSAVTSLQALMQSSITHEKIVEEAGSLQVKCGLSSLDQICIVFFAVVCDQPINVIQEYIGALSKLVKSKDSQLEVIACMEEAVVRAEPSKKQSILTLIPLVLKQLYDEDIVEEDVILAWHSGKAETKHSHFDVSDSIVAQVKAQAQPIVEWLNEASEDDTDEEE